MAVTVNQDIIDRCNDLIALDHDAVAAYESAIDRLKDAEAKRELGRFKEDHERHIRDLTSYVRQAGGQARSSGDMKQVLTQGKVVLRSLTGDKGILQAMKSNEDQTNAKYEEALKMTNLPSDLRALFERNLSDERRHRAWIVDALKRF